MFVGLTRIEFSAVLCLIRHSEMPSGSGTRLGTSRVRRIPDGLEEMKTVEGT